MKYFLPEIEVSTEDGFTDEVDIFKRKSIGENLVNLLEHSEQSLVVALDNKWGEGKTTFLKMWQGHLKNKRQIETIYFDAFANDYIDDPFSALLGELYSYKSKHAPEKSLVKEKYIESAKKVGKAVLKGGMKFAVRYATMNACDGTFLDGNNEDSNKLDKSLSDELAGLPEKIIEDHLVNYDVNKQAISDFETALIDLVKEISPDKPLIFIIDELDRCKPSYSVELLEKIKHLFSVPNIHFVLSLNREQLEASIKGIYGQGINSKLYIQKFIHFSVHLPMKSMNSAKHQAKYIHKLTQRCDVGNDQDDNQFINLFMVFAEHLNLSFRDCERIFSVLLLQLGTGNTGWKYINIPLICMKVLNQDLFFKLGTGKEYFEEVEVFLKN